MMEMVPWTSRNISWLLMLQSRIMRYAQIISKILYWLGTPEEKLKWIFNVFDKDGGGSIDASEIQWMVSGLFAMAGVRIYLSCSFNLGIFWLLTEP